jgi:hypothetical protein
MVWYAMVWYGTVIAMDWISDKVFIVGFDIFLLLINFHAFNGIAWYDKVWFSIICYGSDSIRHITC